MTACAWSGVAITTAFYYTPSGRSIQKPLKAGGQLDSATSVAQGPYRTDSGREVRGGGGIQPDEMVRFSTSTRLRDVIDATGVLIGFATEYIASHEVPEDFEPNAATLDQLKVYLAERQIQPGVGEWLADRDWMQSRVKQEVITLKFGVARGDRIELSRDPAIQQALNRLKR